MALRRGLAARRQVDDEQRHEIAAALQVNERARHAQARPGAGRHVVQIDREILLDRNALGLGPFKVGIAQEVCARDHLRGIRDWLYLLVHLVPPGCLRREYGWTDMANFATLQKTTSI